MSLATLRTAIIKILQKITPVKVANFRKQMIGSILREVITLVKKLKSFLAKALFTSLSTVFHQKILNQLVASRKAYNKILEI